ncbi:MAG: transglutaminase family protein [Bacteroidota bacterium]
MVRLLDDEDPVVQQQIEQELIGMGMEAISRLEGILPTLEDNAIQQQVEAMIARLQSQQIGEQLYEWRKGGGEDLLEAWMLINQIEHPGMDTQVFHNAINRLASRTWLQINVGMNDLEKLSVINRLLYSMEAFSGNHGSPEAPDNNHISFVLNEKQGNSLSMCMLYSILSDKLGVPLQIVNFNGYFALRYLSRDSHFYIDAYNKGLFFTPQQVERFLKKLGAEDNRNTYKPLSNIYVILQLLQALEATHKLAGNDEEVARYQEIQKAIEIRF